MLLERNLVTHPFPSTHRRLARRCVSRQTAGTGVARGATCAGRKDGKSGRPRSRSRAINVWQADQGPLSYTRGRPQCVPFSPRLYRRARRCLRAAGTKLSGRHEERSRATSRWSRLRSCGHQQSDGRRAQQAMDTEKRCRTPGRGRCRPFPKHEARVTTRACVREASVKEQVPQAAGSTGTSSGGSRAVRHRRMPPLVQALQAQAQQKKRLPLRPLETLRITRRLKSGVRTKKLP